MGAFVDGKWREGDFPHDTTGHFVRPDAPFRNWVTATGELGKTVFQTVKVVFMNAQVTPPSVLIQRR